MSDTPRPHRPPPPRRLFAVAAAAAVVGFVVTLSFGYADHAPAPHGVRIAVAAPVPLRQGLTAGLAHTAPGGFTVVAAPSATAVIGSVRSQSAAGGLVLGATGPVRIVTAGAAGSSLQQAITAALLAACGGVLALDTVFSALTGATAALIGVGFLGSFTFVAFAIACQAVTGCRELAWP